MSSYIHDSAMRLFRRYKTRDPFDILSAMQINVFETDSFKALKGYCFLSNRIFYVGISGCLPEEEKKVVAAHELGHIVLHKKLLSVAPMHDTMLYRMSDKTEYEANLFAADLLLDDEDVLNASCEEDQDYFSLCRKLYVSPELMSFKLFSLIRRGHDALRLPLEPEGGFLKK